MIDWGTEALAGHIETISRSQLGQGFVEKIIECLFDVASNLLFAASRSREEDRRRGCLRSTDAVLVVMGHFGRALGLSQHVLQRIPRVRHRADPHRRAIAPALVW